MGTNRRVYIRHPSTLPILYSRRDEAPGDSGRLHDMGLGGVCFDCAEHLQQGTLVEIAIPVLDDSQHFLGRVAWARGNAPPYQTGVRFLNPDDAFRARMTEQLCHIEAYRRTVRAREGRELTSEQAAREWIARYAKEFPKH